LFPNIFRAPEHLYAIGEPVVSALEKAAEVFKVIVTEGIPGLWRFIRERVEDLKSMVLDAVFEFIKEKVIAGGHHLVVTALKSMRAALPRSSHGNANSKNVVREWNMPLD
jgi:hypothetical protein